MVEDLESLGLASIQLNALNNFKELQDLSEAIKAGFLIESRDESAP